MAAYTEKRLAGPTQPGTTTTTLYTVPASTTTIVKQIVMANTDTANAKTIDIAIGSAATAANKIVPTISVAAATVVTIDLSLVLNAADTLQALQQTATAITVTVSGVEKA